MASAKTQHIAIIGAGLSGLSLGLALLQALPPGSTGKPPVTFTIYESRPSSVAEASSNEPVAPSQLDIGGAVMLSPNGLRVLDSLGVYSRIKTRGHNFRSCFFQIASTGKITEVYSFGDKDKYGYDALRLFRRVLVQELIAMLSERGVQVKWGKKFSHIVSEAPHSASSDDGSVRFAFTDGTEDSATLLVGTDGIHSRVRKYMYPGLTPTFKHMGGLTAAVPTANLGISLPKDPAPYALEDRSLPHPLPLTILHPTFGAFVVAPQAQDGSEVLIGRQIRLEEDPGKEGLKGLMGNKQKLIDALRAGTDMEGLPDLVRGAVKEIPEEGVNLWPFYVVPRLDRWLSAGHEGERAGRVVIMGDAAHAVPPSAGQGVNQAFEDAWTFALVVARTLTQGEMPELPAALASWQEWRQSRIDKILELNHQVDLRRMPDAQKTDEMKREQVADLDVDWLYNVDYEGVVRGWF